MQTYIDLIQLRKQKAGFDNRQMGKVIGALQDAGIIPENATELQILKALCEVLYTVHFLAGANDLPLDDAYSKMLMHNIIVKEPHEPIEHIFNKYKTGKLRKASSPIHALMQRVQDVEDMTNREIGSLKEQRKTLAGILEEHGIEIPISNPVISNPPAEQ